MTAASFRVGIRVPDVAEAMRFYRSLGFDEVGVVPGPDGRPVMAILSWGEVHLLLDALEGMPFAETERERRVREGPRGLGVAIGLTVDDLDASLDLCRRGGCEVTAEPADQPWGDRVFECLDPWGYLWEFSTPVAGPSDAASALHATATSWFPGSE